MPEMTDEEIDMAADHAEECLSCGSCEGYREPGSDVPLCDECRELEEV